MTPVLGLNARRIAARPAPPASTGEAMSRHPFDVVVAGCGVAGLSAAVAAREAGASVAVLEHGVGGEVLAYVW